MELQPVVVHTPAWLLAPTLVSVIWLTLTPAGVSVQLTTVEAVPPVLRTVTMYIVLPPLATAETLFVFVISKLAALTTTSVSVLVQDAPPGLQLPPLTRAWFDTLEPAAADTVATTE